MRKKTKTKSKRQSFDITNPGSNSLFLPSSEFIDMRKMSSDHLVVRIYFKGREFTARGDIRSVRDAVTAFFNSNS